MRNILARIVGRLALDKKILENFSRHLSLTEEAVKILRENVRNSKEIIRSKIQETVHSVKILEVRGDELIKESWIFIIKSGVLHPLSTPLISSVMNKLDDMLDNVNVLALEIERYLALPDEHTKMWDRVSTYLYSTLQLCSEAIKTLRESIVETIRLDDLTNNILKVNNIEHEVDIAKNRILLEFSSKANEISCHEYIHARMIVQLVDNLADAAQDLANLLLTLYTMLPGT